MDGSVPASASRRSKLMITMALNKKLRHDIQNSKVKKRNQNVKNNQPKDPDYIISGSDHDSSSESANETNAKVPRLDSHVTADSQIENEISDQSNYDMVMDIIGDVVTLSLDCIEKKHNKHFNKKGQPRKRQRFDTPLRERKRLKKATDSSQHRVKGTCNSNTCRRNCSKFIDETRQNDINSQYWNLSKEEQSLYVNGCVKQMSKERSTTGIRSNSRRQNTYKYFLKNSRGTDINVCKVFFLLTLGYTKNDRFIKNIRTTSKISRITPTATKRGHRPALNKIDKNPIINHIISFQPNISHYRREHAPKRLYLPSDINITMMFNDFKSKNPNLTASYELYGKEVAALNISFAQLGCEECFTCTAFNLHKKEENHEDPSIYIDCDKCSKYLHHKAKYTTARKQYEKDANKLETESELTVSADLEKIIMLPRAEMFKEVIFVPRITVFNESLVPTGKGKQIKPLAVLWHEGIAKRSKEDIISAYYAFFLNRDKENITIWMDNCSAQNKNWTLFCFFVYVVNCKEVNLKTLTVKYFEPGHSFMSADHFHHQVELSMKKHKTIWDFDDFVSCVSSAKGGKTDVIKMNFTNFFNWKDFSSKFKLKKEKFYFKDLIMAVFNRNEDIFQYKTGFEEEQFKTLNFLNNKVAKSGIPMADPRERNHGVALTRKNTLISTLGSIIPNNRLKFWRELDVCDATAAND